MVRKVSLISFGCDFVAVDHVKMHLQTTAPADLRSDGISQDQTVHHVFCSLYFFNAVKSKIQLFSVICTSAA